MKRKLIILLILICALVAYAAVEYKAPKCPACGLEMIEGDYLAPVMGKEGTMYYSHFKCALKKHLRTLKD